MIKASVSLKNHVTFEWVSSLLGLWLTCTEKGSGKALFRGAGRILKALKGIFLVYRLWAGTAGQASKTPCVHPRGLWRSENARRVPTHSQKFKGAGPRATSVV